MAEDPMRKYSDAKAELEKVMDRVKAMQSLITDAGQRLNRPYDFVMSNVDGGWPADTLGSPSLNAEHWPTAQKLAEALISLHQKRREAEHTWAALSQEDRNILTHLPSK